MQAFAGMYEKWRIKRLYAQYRPMCATNTPGWVAFYVDKDATDGADTNMASISQNQLNRVGSAWTPKSLPIVGPDIVGKWFYTGQGDQSSTISVKNALDRQASPGMLYAAVEGCPANTMCGFLDLTGEIEFCDPKPIAALMADMTLAVTTQTGGAYTIIPIGRFHGHGFERVAIDNGDNNFNAWQSNNVGALYITAIFNITAQGTVGNSLFIRLRKLDSSGASTVLSQTASVGTTATNVRFYYTYLANTNAKYWFDWSSDAGVNTITQPSVSLVRLGAGDYGATPAELKEGDPTGVCGPADGPLVADFLTSAGSATVYVSYAPNSVPPQDFESRLAQLEAWLRAASLPEPDCPRPLPGIDHPSHHAASQAAEPSSPISFTAC